ncbi:hypothetical protein GCM10009679_18330 [Saccharothrix algeriensis]|uniref:Transposase IS701-like DDE domain-containing protein n=1 Tax=Catellatospora bangladeshensis TaxID=310355 RepID=A0A8J3NJ72_9ACTN|nr:hypothetical protein Cba03nite_30070 [Catellatospora bangladeshensis]
MLRRALEAGIPARWVTADEAYGKDGKFRLWFQGRRMAYVLAVACNQKIPTEGGSARADALAGLAPVATWKRRSCGERAKCPRLYDWAVATLPDTGTADHGFTRWLLIRRSPRRLVPPLFMGSMPHTQVAISVKTRYHKDPLHRLTANDIVDIDAVSVAYVCEAVFPDKAMRASLQSSKECARSGPSFLDVPRNSPNGWTDFRR